MNAFEINLALSPMPTHTSEGAEMKEQIMKWTCFENISFHTIRTETSLYTFSPYSERFQSLKIHSSLMHTHHRSHPKQTTEWTCSLISKSFHSLQKKRQNSHHTQYIVDFSNVKTQIFEYFFFNAHHFHWTWSAVCLWFYHSFMWLMPNQNYEIFELSQIKIFDKRQIIQMDKISPEFGLHT